MDKEAFDLFCPNCNIMVETKVVARGHGGFRSQALNPINEVDAEYHGDIYYVTLCSRCNQPFLIRQSIYGVPAEFETITDEVVLYPKQSKIPTENIPQAARSAYEQAIRAFSASLYEPCVLMCRKILEIVCKTLGVTGRNLYNRLEKLHDGGYIDNRLLEWSHEIRCLGNEAAHDIDFDINKKDAEDILWLTEAILLYIFSLRASFENFKERRLMKTGKDK